MVKSFFVKSKLAVIAISFILLLFQTIPLFGQIKIHKHLSVDDGLIYSQVLCSLQDKNGYMWFGTVGGLSRWDGISIKNFNLADGLNSNDIQSLAVTNDGTIFIGTRHGVNTFKNNKISTLDSSICLTNCWIERILVSKDNTVYFLTRNQGLWILKNDKFTQLTVEDGLVGEFLWSIHEGIDGSIFIGTEKNGVCVYKNGKFKTLNNENLKSSKIRSIVQDKNGTLFFGTSGKGILVLKNGKYHTITEKDGLPGNIINFFHETDDGGFFIATDKGVAKYRDGKIVEVIDESNGLSYGFVWHIHKDNYNNYYFATDGTGVSIYKPELISTYNINSGLSNNCIWAIHKDKKDNLYIATDNGVNVVKKNGMKHADISNLLLDIMVNAICVISDGSVLFGTNYNGLKILKNGKITTLDDINGITLKAVWALAEDESGKIYLGTYGKGLFIYENGRLLENITMENGLADNKIVSIHCSKKDVYVGTDGGGLSVIKDGKISTINEENGLTNNTVWSIHESKNGIFYLGTDGGGLIVYKNGVIDTLSTEDGLSNNTVLGILEDDFGKLYLTSDHGLSVLDISVNPMIIRNLKKENGLASNEFNMGAYYKDDAGKLWFGTIDGLSCYNPGQDKMNVEPPQTEITRMQLFDEDIFTETLSKKLQFEYNENYLKFEYIGINLNAPEEVNYQYRLTNIDRDWVQTDRRFVQYTNLDDGEYTFEVKACNEWKVWSKPVQLRFKIFPPWWETWWFILFSIVLIISPIVIYTISRFHRLLAIERIRNKIAADLHDDIGSGLTEISILNYVVAQKLAESERDLVSNELDKIGVKSRALIDSMSDIVWLINPKRDSLYDLISRLGDASKEVLCMSGIKFETQNLQSLDKVHLRMEARQHLYLIFKEAINNSIKYSQCDEMLLGVKTRGNEIHLWLQDNGKGFDDAETTHGNGLKNMEQRAITIGGKLKITSKIGKGTVVDFVGKI